MDFPVSHHKFVRVEVIPNDEDGTFVTNLYCDSNHCGNALTIQSSGPKTVQSVSCVKHGLLASFEHQNALGDFVKLLANRQLIANGHALIEAEALSVFGDEQLPSDLLN